MFNLCDIGSQRAAGPAAAPRPPSTAAASPAAPRSDLLQPVLPAQATALHTIEEAQMEGAGVEARATPCLWRHQKLLVSQMAVQWPRGQAGYHLPGLPRQLTRPYHPSSSSSSSRRRWVMRRVLLVARRREVPAGRCRASRLDNVHAWRICRCCWMSFSRPAPLPYARSL